MTEAIDWNAPLEAYHTDGRTVDVALCNPAPWGDGSNPDRQGHYWVDMPPGASCFVAAAGNVYSGWRIRNRKPSLPEGVTPELVARLADCLRKYRDMYISGPIYSEGSAILAEYEAATKPPVDPLVEWFTTGDDIMSGEECAASLRAFLDKRGLTITKAQAS